MQNEIYENFLYIALIEAHEEIKELKQIIETLKEEQLYIKEIDYDWDENAYEIYELFNIDEYIESQKTKKINRR